MVISLFIPIVIITIIAIIALIVIGARGQSKGGETEMIKNVYVYLVLFATLMMTIGGSVSAFMAAADLVAPTPYYQSFEEFKRYDKERAYIDKEGAKQEKLSEKELKDQYDAIVVAEKERQVGRAKNSLIKSCGWIFIPLVIFVYFQRNLIKSRA